MCACVGACVCPLTRTSVYTYSNFHSTANIQAVCHDQLYQCNCGTHKRGSSAVKQVPTPHYSPWTSTRSWRTAPDKSACLLRPHTRHGSSVAAVSAPLLRSAFQKDLTTFCLLTAALVTELMTLVYVHRRHAIKGSSDSDCGANYCTVLITVRVASVSMRPESAACREEKPLALRQGVA